ncbi:MAG: hypothetical protein KatS3mg115_2679 [Candidatus Poribacteria bacterium]|nr:MAG: hypothetical protein KatS3mg115_2679 [Candidatus Poribacteria bacterium]
MRGSEQAVRNEADTRATLVDPKLKAAGWTDRQITREHYYQRDHQYTQGRVILVGSRVRRGESRKVDYLLRLSDAFPIGVVEAKAESEPADAGLEQAKSYARDLGVAFAYATNGHRIIEFDFFTNSSRELERFPGPQELWERWERNAGQVEQFLTAERYPLAFSSVRRSNPLLHPYCPEAQCGKTPFYFQEVAVREVIRRMMLGRKRVLLTMATGTGKTFVAFQVVWKLVKSGWLQRRHPERPARVLFLADRLVLRDQAYNTFAPFADGTSEPRFKIEGHPPNLTRDLYFGIYQTLWSPDEDGRRLFEKFPPDFFDLVIIDECHRSGFGTWREILDHFGSAVHLGMTATPKQDENIDTYAYFCAEEPEVAIDPDHPERGTWRPPAYEYSLGRGIEDGFLATYKVHRVRTTVDATGLHLEDAIEQGAEVFVPEDVEPRELYTTPQFEREITLPDRTRAMVGHLAGLLRRFGKMEKTMVFCVDMEHARLVARLLQDEFGPETGLSNYAVPIISEEGEEGRRALEAFADSDKPAPVVATTAELLSTGVDVPACRNIVFMKTVSSPVLFKQIVGRGSRLDPGADKYWFRIIDFTGATRLFDEWDRPPVPPPEAPTGPQTAVLTGLVFHCRNRPAPRGCPCQRAHRPEQPARAHPHGRGRPLPVRPAPRGPPSGPRERRRVRGPFPRGGDRSGRDHRNRDPAQAGQEEGRQDPGRRARGDHRRRGGVPHRGDRRAAHPRAVPRLHADPDRREGAEPGRPPRHLGGRPAARRRSSRTSPGRASTLRSWPRSWAARRPTPSTSSVTWRSEARSAREASGRTPSPTGSRASSAAMPRRPAGSSSSSWTSTARAGSTSSSPKSSASPRSASGAAR